MRVATTIFATASLLLASIPALHAQNSAPPSAPPATPAAPATASPQLAQIEAMVTNLGYTPTLGSSGKWFWISYPAAKNTYKVDFSLATNNDILYIYISYGISAEQQAHMPAADLLIWNDSHRNYFSLSSDKSQVTLNVNIPVAALTPQALRQTVTYLTEDADDADKMFYPGNWK